MFSNYSDEDKKVEMNTIIQKLSSAGEWQHSSSGNDLEACKKFANNASKNYHQPYRVMHKNKCVAVYVLGEILKD